MPSRPDLAAAVAAVLAFAAALFMLDGGGSNFCLDDAWIHLAYAKSLTLGDGLSYNPGDHATGFSSPLWVVLLSLLPTAANPILPVKLLGALCHSTTAWGASKLGPLLAAERPDPSAAAIDVAAWVAGLLCAFAPALVFASVSGMEVPLGAALLVWTLFYVLSDRPRTATGLAALAVWARPESLFVLVPLAALRFGDRRQHARLLPAAGALLALALWMLYCQSVSGYPFPNTYYAKRAAHLGLGLLYFAAQVLPGEAWFLGIGGVWLLSRAVARRKSARWIVLSWACAVIGIAASRSIIPGTDFFCARYFSVFAALPCVAIASALPDRAVLRWVALAPVALAALVALPQQRALQRAQERDITLLHSEPARWLTRVLPPNSRIAAEGAGAMRYVLPRSVRVIDVIGLNFAPAAHAANDIERLCAVLRAHPTHVLLPDEQTPLFAHFLRLRLLRSFVDPHSALTLRSSVRHVHAAVIGPIAASTRELCRLQ